MTHNDELLERLNVVVGMVNAAHATFNLAFSKLQKIRNQMPVLDATDSICRAQVAIADVWDHLEDLIEQAKKMEESV